jgi:hypothetical protein
MPSSSSSPNDAAPFLEHRQEQRRRILARGGRHQRFGDERMKRLARVALALEFVDRDQAAVRGAERLLLGRDQTRGRLLDAVRHLDMGEQLARLFRRHFMIAYDSEGSAPLLEVPTQPRDIRRVVQVPEHAQHAAETAHDRAVPVHAVGLGAQRRALRLIEVAHQAAKRFGDHVSGGVLHVTSICGHSTRMQDD